MGTTTTAVSTWTIDAAHAEVGFSVRHLMISTVRGRFGAVTGTVQYDEAEPSNSKIDVTIDVTSIDTRQEQRDNHLRSADFFDVANFPSMEVRPGSMGRPVPGVEAGIVRPHEDGGVEVVEAAGEVGELALRPGWPSMFRGYLNEEARYRKCFRDGWYLSGDLARRDADGYYGFVGRADDVIKAAGHLISPFEVESVLMTHAAVSQAGVIGVPDPVAGSAVKAFVELKAGQVASEALRKDILAHARRQLGVAVAPREIAFSEQLPRTRSGKIMRRLLRARELGLPEGDLSTLEGAT